MNTVYAVHYRTPYNETEWRSQDYATLEIAQRMRDFYIDCGSPSYILMEERSTSDSMV